METKERLKYKKGRRLNIGIESYLLKTSIALTFANNCMCYHALAWTESDKRQVLITWNSDNDGDLCDIENPKEIRSFDLQ